jgi:HD-GYP domain-containing protein (c-di-GMP phosphodiesterase class II)
VTYNNHKKAPSWSKLQNWFLELAASEGNNGNGSPSRAETAAAPGLKGESFFERSIPKLNYQMFLENASKSMIRFKKPEHLIKMIVRVISEQLKVTHCAILLYKEAKDSYILIDSKGEGGLKIPIGYIRITVENPLIRVFTERQNFLISVTGTLNYGDIITCLKNREILDKEPELYNELLAIKKQMDLLKASICVPCYFKKDLLGIMLLGDKINGERFGRSEQGFFVTLANDAAMAISNAQLINSLQQKVDEIKELYNREHRIFIHTAIALAAAIDARDPYTHGHTERVTNYCLAIAKELDGVPDMAYYRNFRETLHIAALLHDVGKIGIPDHILNKTGTLTPEEYEEVKKHPVIGAMIINPIKELGDVVKEVRHHQEMFDGGGYPDGLKDGEIPFIARIIAAADAFDAMTTDRPYRAKKNYDEAIKELKKYSGTQFDPVIVSALILAYEKGNLVASHKGRRPKA